MQYGSGWWFLDQLDGMTKQMEALSNMGLLARFVGMVTDSRSSCRTSRHEYFRRLLCNLIGEDVRRGRLPDDRGSARPPRPQRLFLQCRASTSAFRSGKPRRASTRARRNGVNPVGVEA